MKKQVLSLVAFATAAFLVFDAQTASTYSTTPPAAHTGAMAESTCGKSSCHNVGANIGGGSLNVVYTPVVGASTNYTPGSAAAFFSVVVQDATNLRNGFEMVALDAAGNNAGTFTAMATALPTQIQSSGGKSYISHQNVSTPGLTTGSTFQFSWTAPATNVGDITFYTAAIAGNNNGNDNGDELYTNSLTITPFISSINDNTIMASVYPNPTSDNLTITTADNVEMVKIFSIAGVEVSTVANTNQINVSNLAPAVYFAQITTAKGTVNVRFIKS
jgi:hypothetical protein